MNASNGKYADRKKGGLPSLNWRSLTPMREVRKNLSGQIEGPLFDFALRAFGIANLWFVARGGWLIYATLKGYSSASALPVDPRIRPPGSETVFLALTCVNIGLLLLLLWAGVLLLRLRITGVVICNGVFIAEIVLFLIPPPIPVTPLTNLLSAARIIGNMGIAPQILTAYPLLGLVVLNALVRWRRPAMTSAAKT